MRIKLMSASSDAPQQIMHIRRMVLLIGQNPLQHQPRRRVLVVKIIDQITIMLNRDALGHEILLHQLNQRSIMAIFRGRAGG